MKTDRELLELAARAAGYALTDGSRGYDEFKCKGGVKWNPLTDDGDALRLANSLGLTIGQTYDGAYVDLCSGEILQHMEFGCQHEVKWASHDGDKNAATRRAIVRAAAAIGEVM